MLQLHSGILMILLQGNLLSITHRNMIKKLPGEINYNGNGEQLKNNGLNS